MKRKPKALSVPVVVPDLILDAKRAEKKKRLYHTSGAHNSRDFFEEATPQTERG